VSIDIRPYVCGRDDALWVSITNRATDEYPEVTPETPHDFQLYKDGPWFDATGMMVAELDGEPAGCANAYIEDSVPTEEHGYLEGPWVTPERRGLGIGTALAGAVFESLRRRGKTRVQLWHRDNPGSVAFARGLGFRCVRVFHSMSHDLTSILNGIGESPDVVLSELPDSEPTYELESRLFNESFREHFDYHALPVADIRHIYRASRERNEWLFALVAGLGDEPVGFILGGADPAEQQRRGKNLGGLYMLGVLKPFRGRGIAKALLIAGLKRLRERGIIEAELGVDTENVTGALNLYERLGFRTTRRRLVQVRDLT
jgi:mycothiol synthase